MLEQMTARLHARRTFEGAVSRILDDVVALHGAEFGDLQLLDGQELVIVAQRGLNRKFVEAFMRVGTDDGSACGRALRERNSVAVVDVDADPEYIAFRADARAAGYRSVQSTPLINSQNQLIGVVSTLFANVHRPTSIEMETLKRYSLTAADHLTRLLDQKLDAKARRMNALLRAKLAKSAQE